MDQVTCPLRIQKACLKAAGAFFVFVACTRIVAAQGPSEYQLKAAFLMNFTRFVDWPPSAFNSPASPITICVLGENPFGSDLDQLVEGETVKGRKVVVERLRQPPSPKSCQLLFAGKSEMQISALLSGLGPGVLTVSDRDRFLLEGGMIALVNEGKHVRFDVNQRAALRASLTISALLLNAARSVQR